MRGLKRGILGGLLLAIIVFFLPDGLLGAVTVGTGLASVLPAAAPPLGTTARLLLSVIALLIGFALTFWLVRRSRPAWDVDDSTDAEPLSAAEQMVVSPAYAMPQASAPATAAVNDRELDRRLARIEAAITDVPGQISRALAGSAPAASDQASLLARIDALEVQIGERLAAIDSRLSEGGGDADGRPYPSTLRASKRTSPSLANIRRTLDDR